MLSSILCIPLYIGTQVYFVYRYNRIQVYFVYRYHALGSVIKIIATCINSGLTLYIRSSEHCSP